MILKEVCMIIGLYALLGKYLIGTSDRLYAFISRSEIV